MNELNQAVRLRPTDADAKQVTDEADVPAMGEGCELPLDFDIGIAVHCSDDLCGKLQHVVMDPSSGKVTDLVVKNGFLQRWSRVVPVSSVQKVTEQGIWIGLTVERLRDHKEYREVEFMAPDAGWYHRQYRQNDVRYPITPYDGLVGQSVSPTQRYTFREGLPFESQVIGKGTKLRDLKGEFGEIDHVLVDCHEGDITHIVVRRGWLADYRILTLDDVAEIDEDGVELKVGRADLDRYPQYHPR